MPQVRRYIGHSIDTPKIIPDNIRTSVKHLIRSASNLCFFLSIVVNCNFGFLRSEVSSLGLLSRSKPNGKLGIPCAR